MIALLIPVMRAEKIAALIENIDRTTDAPHQIYWACTKPSECCDVLLGLGEFVYTDEGDTWGHRINRLFDLTKEPYVFLGADDVRFHEGWDEHALKAIDSIQGVVSVNDLSNPNGTLALVSRRYINNQSGCVDTPGVVIYPGYSHNFSETELFETARRRGRFAYCATSIVEHVHPDANKAEDDEIYQLGRARLEEDKALFNSRRHFWI